MDAELKRRITSNRFGDALMEYRIDHDAFRDYCECLDRLALAWKGQLMVDKEVVLHVYATASIIRNTVIQFQQKKLRAEASELEDMFIELDRRVVEECLRVD